MKQQYKFRNTPLPYSYDAMEPYIDEETMEVHHNIYLQSYIDNLNNILENYPELQDLTLGQLIYNVDMFPKEIQVPIKNNAGGVFNHQFYFSELGNLENKEPIGELEEAINKKFGSYNEFKNKFKATALSVFGSGYAWLVLDKDKQLQIITTINQDNPFTEGLCPILNIDLWEHAYYAMHYNKRADYIDDWFNVINWNIILENYLKCMSW